MRSVLPARRALSTPARRALSTSPFPNTSAVNIDAPPFPPRIATDFTCSTFIFSRPRRSPQPPRVIYVFLAPRRSPQPLRCFNAFMFVRPSLVAATAALDVPPPWVATDATWCQRISFVSPRSVAKIASQFQRISGCFTPPGWSQPLRNVDKFIVFFSPPSIATAAA